MVLLFSTHTPIGWENNAHEPSLLPVSPVPAIISTWPSDDAILTCWDLTSVKRRYTMHFGTRACLVGNEKHVTVRIEIHLKYPTIVCNEERSIADKHITWIPTVLWIRMCGVDKTWDTNSIQTNLDKVQHVFLVRRRNYGIITYYTSDIYCHVSFKVDGIYPFSSVFVVFFLFSRYSATVQSCSKPTLCKNSWRDCFVFSLLGIKPTFLSVSTNGVDCSSFLW